MQRVEDSKALCRRYKLDHVAADQLEIRRQRRGRGFSYLDANGNCIRDKALKARLARLAIPPAWTDVCIAESETAHIQAIGRDAEGRLQYRYHPIWDEARAEKKEGRLIRFGKALPRVRDTVAKALAKPKLTRKKIVAAIVRLMDQASLRPGHEEYARKGGGRGAATLLKDDVTVTADTVVLDFHAKSGKQIHRVVKDRMLARVISQLKRWRGRRLFDMPGTDAPQIGARDVNAFLAEASGLPISAKDFRTFRASAGALAALSETNGNGTKAERRKALIEAADAASEELANTRAVARSSYIHPSVIKAHEEGRLDASLLKSRVRKGLSRIETGLLRFLEARGK